MTINVREIVRWTVSSENSQAISDYQNGELSVEKIALLNDYNSVSRVFYPSALVITEEELDALIMEEFGDRVQIKTYPSGVRADDYIFQVI